MRSLDSSLRRCPCACFTGETREPCSRPPKGVEQEERRVEPGLVRVTNPPELSHTEMTSAGPGHLQSWL